MSCPAETLTRGLRERRRDRASWLAPPLPRGAGRFPPIRRTLPADRRGLVVAEPHLGVTEPSPRSGERRGLAYAVLTAAILTLMGEAVGIAHGLAILFGR